MFKNKKGFTLVELLAVIVILAIILAIAIPSITNITTKAKQDSFASDVKMIIKTLDTYNLGHDTKICATATSSTTCVMTGANITALGLNSSDYNVTATTGIIVNGNGPTTLSSVEPSATSKFANCAISGTASMGSVTVTGC